ncbi:GH1 family beta-glucosidase [Bowmanella dokdonensis]
MATASFQIEGAVDKRLPCIWDTFCAEAGRIRDGSDGSMACDHVRLWKQDVEMIYSLGVDAYRFSVSWTRVMHADGSPNQQGLDFYLQLLERLNSLGIKAFVTLYHWDLPQYLQDQGGWLNRETAYKFRDYADLVARSFGDRVYSWATLNEPYCSAYLGHELGIHAPGLKSRAQSKQAAHHLLLAHGLAMQVLRTHCPTAQSGIVLNFSPCYAKTDRAEDVQAANLADQYFNQWYLLPVLTGRYPELLDRLPVNDRPPIEEGDMQIIAQPLDYLGINYYTREVYEAHDQHWFANLQEKQGPLTDMGWEIYPQGLTDLLVTYHQQYDLPPIYITENGAAMPDKLVDGKVTDKDRVEYLNSHIHAVHEAARMGVDIRGYFAWSLMDNFEWAEGYLKRFGLVYVDYPTQKRIIKASGLAYRDFLARRQQQSGSSHRQVGESN